MSYNAEKIKTQRIGAPHERGEWRQAEVYQHDSKPSWKRYGRGVSSAKVSAVIGNDGVALLEISVSETSIAGGLEKRDVTKEAYFTAYGPGALAIYEALKAAFEPFKAGDTIFDVDGNAHTVTFDGYAALNVNPKIRFALEGEMIACFSRENPRK